jgi:uncharacterized protein (TIGR03435 family)
MNRWMIAISMICGAVYGQESRPAFEVAEIKPADPAGPRPGKGRILPGGRIEVPGMTVKDLMMMAYGLQENMITGGPKWVGSQRFDIVAKAPAETPMATLRLMMQTLLAERFHLATHREDKAMPAYVLTVGKRPPTFREGSGGRGMCTWQSDDGGLRRRECVNMTMSELVKELPGWGGVGIDLPVVDETGLKGAYDFHLEVGMMGGGKGEGGKAQEVALESGPNIFAAFEKIGLKLESRKMTMPVVVIDRAEMPGAN